MVKRLLPSSCRNDSILHPMFNMNRRSSCSSRSDRPVYVRPKNKTSYSILHPCMIVGPAVSCFIPNILVWTNKTFPIIISFNKKQSHLGRCVCVLLHFCLLACFQLVMKNAQYEILQVSNELKFSEEYISRASRHQKGLGIVGTTATTKP